MRRGVETPNVEAGGGRPITALTTSFYHYDGLGATRLLSDASAAVTDQYGFEAFGAKDSTASVGETPNGYLYAGEQYDPNLGFYYLRARYMQPVIGSFVGMDSFQGFYRDPMTLHKYVYTGNSPVSSIDPSGNFYVGISMVTTSVGRAILWQLAKPLLKRAVKAMLLAAIVPAAYIITRSSKRDEEVPRFLVGNDYPDIKSHVEQAQLSMMISPVVHRRSAPHARGWLRTSLVKGTCGSGFTGGQTGKECDKYPMAIHAEGGRENFEKGLVSVKAASVSQNGGVGGSLPHFHSRCNIKPDDPGPDGAYVFGTIDGPTVGLCSGEML